MEKTLKQSWCSCDVYLAKKILLRAIESEAVKQTTIEILRNLSQLTDNQIDDALVEQLELAMYCMNKKNT